MHLLLSHGEQLTADAARVDSKLGDEPDDELIELLQAGVSRRFDKIREVLQSFVSEAKRDLGKMGGKKPAAAGVPGREPEKNAAGNDVPEKKEAAREPEAPKAAKDNGISEDEIDKAVDMLDDLKIDM